MGTVANTTAEKNTGNLIPYADYDSEGERIWGYLNEDSGEIVITAKYNHVNPFVGNYTTVMPNRWDTYIIDINEKRINVGQFDRAFFLAPESGKGAAVLLERKFQRKIFRFGGSFLGSSWSTGFYTEDYYKFRMINLVNGKTVIRNHVSYLSQCIENIGNYFLADKDLYQFLDNGNIICVAKNNIPLAAQILRGYFEQRGISAVVETSYRISINYRPYIREKFANPDFGKALQDLPSHFDMTYDKSEPFYREHTELLNAPLDISERKFLLHFTNEDPRGRVMGIYSESKGEWELPPWMEITDTETNITHTFYVTGIQKTNNPDIYGINITNAKIGWHRNVLVYGGYYSISKKEFMPNLYDEYPPRGGVILMMGGSTGRMINFPDFGTYYADFSRLK